MLKSSEVSSQAVRGTERAVSISQDREDLVPYGVKFLWTSRRQETVSAWRTSSCRNSCSFASSSGTGPGRGVMRRRAGGISGSAPARYRAQARRMNSVSRACLRISINKEERGDQLNPGVGHRPVFSSHPGAEIFADFTSFFEMFPLGRFIFGQESEKNNKKPRALTF